MHRNAIEAARVARAQRALYTGHQGARLDFAFAQPHHHAVTKTYFTHSSLRYKPLRHGVYAESALPIGYHGLKTGEICAPEDGPVSWTARSNLA